MLPASRSGGRLAARDRLQRRLHALLRLLWAASDDPGPHVPSRITRAAPDAFTTTVSPALRGPLHALLSGTSRRLLDEMATAVERRDAYLQPGLARDLDAAVGFLDHGPRALRRLRLRHGEPATPMSRTVIEKLLTIEVRAAIGEFRLPAPRDDADAHLGRKAQPWTRHRS